MPWAISIDRRFRDASLPALLAAAAGFVVTWLLLSPPAVTPVQPTALLRVRQNGGSSEIATDEAVSRLLGSESLAATLMEPGVLGRRIEAAAALDMAEAIRDSVRVDIRLPDEAGIQEVRVRWAGDPHKKIGGRLVKALARQLATGLAKRADAAADTTEWRRQYEAARSELVAAETALAEARARFEAALNEPVRAHTDRPPPEPRRKEAIADSPARGLPNAVEADDAQLMRQRLAELEQRRQLLADRLMPEHPEMKALEEKIEELRSAIAVLPRSQPAIEQRPPPAEIPPVRRARQEPDEKQIARSGQLWQAVVEAQNRYAAALAHERECRNSLSATPGQLVAEIESTADVAPTIERAAWRRWLLSALTAVLCGGLVFALWPSRRLTFASAEEVRAVTRLPVVVIESGSLN